MGTVNATLLSAEPVTTWAQATSSWSSSSQRNAKWSSQALHPGDLLPLLMQFAACFLLPGESYSLPILKKVGGNEVN